MLFKNVNVKVHKSNISPAVLYVCGNRFLTLWKGERLRMTENRLRRSMFGFMGNKWPKAREDCTVTRAIV
jgi:hypothetical protein